jgi:hypothetical protein
MKNNFIYILFISFSFIANAGNEDRVGSAGASQLLANPWARSTALGDANVANSNGIEATFVNIAGLAYTDKTQLKFNHTNWLGNSGIRFTSAGFAQRLSESSVLGISVQSMGFGDIAITTVENPDGGIGTFTPRVSIVNIGYAKQFIHSISGGFNIKVVSESISNLKSTGIAIDAGIRYVTGDKDQTKIGITLKNVGPPISQKGDGLATQVTYVSTGNVATVEQRSSAYELPSLLSLGASHDFIFSEKSKLTACAAFTGNSFSRDQFRVGLDYGVVNEKSAFNVRVGYVYEKNIYNKENSTNALTGLTAGLSIDALVGKNKSALGLEYAARLSSPFGLIHTFGTTISIK